MRKRRSPWRAARTGTWCLSIRAVSSDTLYGSKTSRNAALSRSPCPSPSGVSSVHAPRSERSRCRACRLAHLGPQTSQLNKRGLSQHLTSTERTPFGVSATLRNALAGQAAMGTAGYTILAVELPHAGGSKLKKISTYLESHPTPKLYKRLTM